MVFCRKSKEVGYKFVPFAMATELTAHSVSGKVDWMC